MLEQLAQQLSALTRQAKQAARYREIGEELRQAEGMLLYRRWREADEARAEAEAALRERLIAHGAGRSGGPGGRQGARGGRGRAAAAREEEAIAAAILQRLMLQRDALGEPGGPRAWRDRRR